MKEATDIRQGDCREVMRAMPDCSVDAIVTDPPYGLSFMGKDWDTGIVAFSPEIWIEALRVAKPGAHLLAAGGQRTHHRLMVAIEDAGWQIRDVIMHVFGSGFPKSHNISKALRAMPSCSCRVSKVVGKVGTVSESIHSSNYTPERLACPDCGGVIQENIPEGFGTALKPAYEPWILARKPLIGNVAENVLRYGTGGINVDGCRVAGDDAQEGRTRHGGGAAFAQGSSGFKQDAITTSPSGRFPANLIHSGEDDVREVFPVTGPSKATPRNNGEFKSVDDGGSAAQFFQVCPLDVVARCAACGFESTVSRDDNEECPRCLQRTGWQHQETARSIIYTAKASKRDRDEGCEGMEEDARRMFASGGRTMKDGKWVETDSAPLPRRNHHPTVKPTSLMRYLCRLITPPGGVVLDPFCGSGSTGKGAVLEGFRFIGIEREPEYVEIARARIAHAMRERVDLFTQ